MSDDDSQTPSQFITDFVLEQIEQQPVERQLRLLRALACATTDEALANDCRVHAAALSESMRRARQMRLNFRQRQGGKA